MVDTNFAELQEITLKNNIAHGFTGNRDFGTLIALMHSELSEALEESRKGLQPHEIYFVCPTCGKLDDGEYEINKDGIAICNFEENRCKPEGIAVELIDCWIRILDVGGVYNIDLDKAYALKHAYNVTRPYKHGKLF